MAATPITFRCPCGQPLRVRPEDAGKPVTCPCCRAVTTSPGIRTPSAVPLSSSLAGARAGPRPVGAGVPAEDPVGTILADLAVALDAAPSADARQERLNDALVALRPLYRSARHLFTDAVLGHIEGFK